MTPGYGFAYFRWRTILGGAWDESKKLPIYRNWRELDQAHFAKLQSCKP